MGSARSPLASPRLPLRRPARRFARHWPRVALLGVVLAIAFGVLSMHDLVRPMSVEDPMGSVSQVGTSRMDPLAAGAGTGTTEAPMVAAPSPAGVMSDGAAVAGAASGARDTGVCASCGHLSSAMAVCIVVLSLLLLVLRVPSLRAQLAPPTAAFYVASWVSAPRQPRPPTQAELSVCRT